MYTYFTQQYKKKLNQHTHKHGYDAVGVAMAVVFFIGVLLIPLGIFLFIFPRLVLDQDVQQLANTVRLDGYVREEVYEAFAGKLENRGYSDEEIAQGVQVFVVDSPLATTDSRYSDGKSLIQSSGQPNPPIVQRGEGKMAIQVILPANANVFRQAVKNFGGEPGNAAQTYKISRVVMSEAVVRPTAP